MGLYGEFLYGEDTYGLSSFPSTTDFDIFDFCHPNDSSMLSLFSFGDVTPSRSFALPHYEFSGSNDLCMFSDDDLDSGFRIDMPITDGFTLQWSFLPTELPTDFSSTSDSRFFVAAYNQYGKMAGFLLSENEGVALAQTGDGPYTKIVDSDDLFHGTTDYYTFRVTINKVSGRGNLYITRNDLLPILGHQLRFTFNALDTPDSTLDHVKVEVVGNAVNSTTICLDCIRLSSQEIIPNERPIAIPGDEQIVNLNSYASFDGRQSYDPDNFPGDPLTYWWTCTRAPSTSPLLWESGEADTAADVSGYTNVLNGSAGDFSSVRPGDLLRVEDGESPVLYVHTDGSYVVAIDRVFPESLTDVPWTVLKQASWGGSWTESLVHTVVQDAVASLPGSPTPGDYYLMTSGLNDEKIAYWNGISWTYITPDEGDVIYNVTTYKSFRYINGTHPSGYWEEMDPYPWELAHWSGRTLNIGSFLPDTRGGHIMTLTVYDGDLSSLPTEVVLNVQESRMPFGIIPDLKWIWSLISDFWTVVEDREKIETIWSAFTQIAAGLLMELWQHDYAKSILDIQRVFQKKWISYRTTYPEPNYIDLPAAINNPMSFGGWSATPGSNEYYYETGIDLTGFTTDNAFVLDGEVYKIARFVEDPIAAPGYPTSVFLLDPLPSGTHSSYWQIRPTVVSQSSDFTAVTIREGDTAVFEVVDTSNDTSQDVETHIYGARQSILCFDDAPITTYLASDQYTVRFKQVNRRNQLNILDSIVGIPQLQEYINPDLDAADDPQVQNNDYYIETSNTIVSTSINVIRFDDSWYEELATGVDGATSVAASVATFNSSSAGFNELIGENGTDAKGYFLLIDGKKHRLYDVDSDTDVQFEDVSVADGLSALRWKLLRPLTPPTYLWAELTYVDNEPTIQANFGRLVGLSTELLEDSSEDVDYLSAVRGLWYTYWFGPTPFNIRVGAQILLGLPFAEKAGDIIDITSPFDETRSRILIQDSDNDTIIRTYYYPTELGIAVNPETSVAYTSGDSVQQFFPLSAGVTITDWVEDEDWFNFYSGSGDFYEPWKVHNFGIIVDADAFSLENIQFVLSYVRRIRPHYTDPWLVVRSEVEDIVDVEDAILLGPVIPIFGSSYPSGWAAYPTPDGWSSSPWETPRSSDPVLVTDAVGNQSATPFVPINHGIETFGGLHLADAPARVPDSWTGTLLDGSTHNPTAAEGVFQVDAMDQSGNPIHRLDDIGIFPTDQYFTDPDMETAGVTNWPAVGSPTTRAKSGSIFYAGSQSLEIQDSSSGVGAYQDFPATSNEGFQSAVTGRIRVEDGQAHLILYDHDGSVAAEKRITHTGTQWVEFTLHSWSAVAYASPLKFEAITGPVGGHFYLDNVGGWMKQVPWTQWGSDRTHSGRTGGYTEGGSPDEYWLFRMHAEFS